MGSIPSKRNSVSEGNHGVATAADPASSGDVVSARVNGGGEEVRRGQFSSVNSEQTSNYSDQPVAGKPSVGQDVGGIHSSTELLNLNHVKIDQLPVGSKKQINGNKAIRKRKFRNKKPANAQTVAVKPKKLPPNPPPKVVIRNRRNIQTRFIPSYGVRVNTSKLRARSTLRKNLQNLIEESESLINQNLSGKNNVNSGAVKKRNFEIKNDINESNIKVDSPAYELPVLRNDEFDHTKKSNYKGQKYSDTDVDNSQDIFKDRYSSVLKTEKDINGNSWKNEEEEKGSFHKINEGYNISQGTSNKSTKQITLAKDDRYSSSAIISDKSAVSNKSFVDGWHSDYSPVPLNRTIRIVRNNPEDRLVRGFIDVSKEKATKVTKQSNNKITKVIQNFKVVNRKSLTRKKLNRFPIQENTSTISQNTSASVVKENSEIHSDIGLNTNTNEVLATTNLKPKVVKRKIKRQKLFKNPRIVRNKKQSVDPAQQSSDDNENSQLTSFDKIPQLDTIDDKNIGLVFTALEKGKKARLTRFISRNKTSSFPKAAETHPPLNNLKTERSIQFVPKTVTGHNFLRRSQKKSKLGYVSETFVDPELLNTYFAHGKNIIGKSETNENQVQKVLPNALVVENHPSRTESTNSLQQSTTGKPGANPCKYTKVENNKTTNSTIPLKLINISNRITIPLRPFKTKRHNDPRQFSVIPIPTKPKLETVLVGQKRGWSERTFNVTTAKKKRTLLSVIPTVPNVVKAVRHNNMSTLTGKNTKITVSERNKILQKYPLVKLNLPIIKITKPESDEDGDESELYRGMDDYWNDWEPTDVKPIKKSPVVSKKTKFIPYTKHIAKPLVKKRPQKSNNNTVTHKLPDVKTKGQKVKKPLLLDKSKSEIYKVPDDKPTIADILVSDISDSSQLANHIEEEKVEEDKKNEDAVNDKVSIIILLFHTLATGVM